MDPIALKTFIEDELQPEDLDNYNTGFNEVCPRYTQLDEKKKREAVSAFSIAIVESESNFDSFAVYFEKSLGYTSIGLFSFSYSDKDVYKCNFTKPENQNANIRDQDIIKTDRQVDCYLKVSRRLIREPEDFSYLRKLSNGQTSRLNIKQKLSAYWSVLRTSNKSGHSRYEDSLDEFLPEECN